MCVISMAYARHTQQFFIAILLSKKVVIDTPRRFSIFTEYPKEKPSPASRIVGCSRFCPWAKALCGQTSARL